MSPSSLALGHGAQPHISRARRAEGERPSNSSSSSSGLLEAGGRERGAAELSEPWGRREGAAEELSKP